MTISDVSSRANSPANTAATGTNSAPPRKRYRLTGPSRPIDPAVEAVRRDLADIALADRVFAQHYVVPVTCRVTCATPIVSTPSADAPVAAMLVAGDRFHVLDVGRNWAWGRGDAVATVGYVPTRALEGDCVEAR